MYIVTKLYKFQVCNMHKMSVGAVLYIKILVVMFRYSTAVQYKKCTSENKRVGKKNGEKKTIYTVSGTYIQLYTQNVQNILWCMVCKPIDYI